MMKNLRKAGGISAIISALSYVFAIGLYLTLMMPLADSGLGIHEYMAVFIPMKRLVFVWTFSMYVVHGVSLVVLVAALRERIDGASPGLAAVASYFGFIRHYKLRTQNPLFSDSYICAIKCAINPCIYSHIM